MELRVEFFFLCCFFCLFFSKHFGWVGNGKKNKNNNNNNNNNDKQRILQAAAWELPGPWALLARRAASARSKPGADPSKLRFEQQ